MATSDTSAPTADQRPEGAQIEREEHAATPAITPSDRGDSLQASIKDAL